MAAVNNVKMTMATIQEAAKCGVTDSLDDMVRKKITKGSRNSETESAIPQGTAQQNLQKLFLCLNAETPNEQSRAMSLSDVIGTDSIPGNARLSANVTENSKSAPMAVNSAVQSQGVDSTSKMRNPVLTERTEAVSQNRVQRLSGAKSAIDAVRQGQTDKPLALQRGDADNAIPSRITNVGQIIAPNAADADRPVAFGAMNNEISIASKAENSSLAGQQKIPLGQKETVIVDQDKSPIPLTGSEHQRPPSYLGQHSDNGVKEMAPQQPKPSVSIANNSVAVEESRDSKLTYSFSDWGKGHQVNIQLATNNAAPLVLHPSDTLVHQRLADHGGQEKQGEPEWVFSDEQEQPKDPRQQQRDEEQA